ncbi:hypothetical protein [Sphingomonas sp. 8AM]|nr:hypothetical protein [Sphingomonas sp. 8AM]VXD01559.1 hypothetical protein SPHINGO8AM_80085 [Sphingomonas sp. 8AM]
MLPEVVTQGAGLAATGLEHTVEQRARPIGGTGAGENIGARLRPQEAG